MPLFGSYEIPEDSAVIFCEDGRYKNLVNAGWGKAHGYRNGVFEKVNGYSNEYWGWGREDDDMFVRLRARNIPTFKSLIDFEFFMEHFCLDTGNNIDKQDAVPHDKINELLLQKMRANPDPLVSGLNTLSYEIVEPLKPYGQKDVYKITVSI